MDGRVLDAPWPVRWAIVNWTILPGRPAQSAEAYHKIWTPEGSPLIVTSRKVRAALEQRLGIPVELAMRYGNPSIQSALRRLRDQQRRDVLLIPLFPHYAMSSYETAVRRVLDLAANVASELSLTVLPPYYDHPDYIGALAAGARQYLEADCDHLLFSFHGIPERHLRKADPTGCHCLSKKDCCETASPAHQTCYRAQCFKTVAAFVNQTGLPAHRYSVAFQSRLGRDPWLKPYANLVIQSLAKSGVKRLAVICPAFVSDCLETIEEIGLRGREAFLRAGGQELTLIPCLNDQPLWIAALENMASAWQGKTARASAPEPSVGCRGPVSV